MKIIGGIIAAAGMVAAFVLGFVALAVIAGLVVLFVAVFSLRIAWLKRKWRQQQPDIDQAGISRPEQAQPDNDSIEADYTVVSRRRR